MGLSIDEILQRATPRVEEARVCIDGALLGEHSRLTRELEEIQRPRSGRKMGGASPEAKALAQRIVDLEGEIEKAKVTFTFTAMSAAAQGSLRARFPGRGPAGWDVEKGAAAYIAACSLDPKMSEEQAEALCERIGAGGATELFNAAQNATNGATNIAPFALASALTTGSV